MEAKIQGCTYFPTSVDREEDHLAYLNSRVLYQRFYKYGTGKIYQL